MGDAPIKATIEVKGLKALQSALEDLGTKKAKAIVRPALVEWGKMTVNYMIDLAPAKTNFLTRHLDYKVRMLRGDNIAGKVQVGPTNDVYPDQATFDYESDAKARQLEKGTRKKHARTARMVASWLEFGTSKMAARPFMRQAIQRHIDDLIEFVSKLIREKLGLK